MEVSTFYHASFVKAKREYITKPYNAIFENI